MNGTQILKAEGKAEGKAETLIANARRMLDRDFDSETIADVLEISIELVTGLKDGGEPDLDTWIEAISH